MSQASKSRMKQPNAMYELDISSGSKVSLAMRWLLCLVVLSTCYITHGLREIGASVHVLLLFLDDHG